jgi:hypothetical protein
MSISHILDDGQIATIPLIATTMTSGTQFASYFVPIGTVAYSIPIKQSSIVCLRAETLSSVTWTLPKVSSCAGLQMSLINKSTATTINLVVQSGDSLPSYFSPPQIPPSGGVGNDQFYYFQSDGIDSWQ